MNKYFRIVPRQVGKTTVAYYEYTKDPKNSLWVVLNYNMADALRKEYKCENIISSSEFVKKVQGKRLSNIILDDYFNFTNFKDGYLEIKFMQLSNLLIFSTPTKIYNTTAVEFVKRYKALLSLDEMLDANVYIHLDSSYQDFLESVRADIKLQDEIKDLYYNFLTDEDIIISTDRPNRNYKFSNTSLLGDTKHKTEILGIYQDY